MLLSRNLKETIMMTGLSYSDFAQLAGTTTQNIDRISKGGKTRLSTANRIIHVLNDQGRTPCTLADLDINIED